jgi:hypothetical protein
MQDQMRIYSIGPLDDAQRLDMSVDHQMKVLSTLGQGIPFQGDWAPLSVWSLKKPRKRRLENLCDLSVIAAKLSVPVMSGRAKSVFEPLLGASAQWLRLDFEAGSYWLLNSLRVLNALDVPKSAIRYFSNGSLWEVERYALQPSVVADELLFKVSTAPYDVLVTERFRAVVVENGLTGFHFQPVWDSEHRPFRPVASGEEMLKRPEIYGPEGFVPNLEEYWPPHWKEQGRQLKRLAKESAANRV